MITQSVDQWPLPRLRRFLRPFPLAVLCLTGFAHAQVTIQVPSGQPTIQAGIDAANDGDTVLVAPGKYFENVDFHGKAVTLVSSGGASVTTIDGGLVKPVVSLGTLTNMPAVLDGFTVQRGIPVPSPVFAQLGGGVIVVGSATVQNNTVTANESCGIDVATYGVIAVKANHVFNNGFVITPGPSSGCYIDGTGIDVELAVSTALPSSTVTISENLVENNAGDGIQGDFENQDMSILRNRVYGNGGGGISVFSLYGPGIVANNLVYGNTGGGIFAEYNAPSTLSILNNTLYANSGSASNNATNTTELAVSGGNVEVVNNLIIHPTAGVEPVLRCSSDFASPLPVAFDHNDIYPPSTDATNSGCLVNGFGNRSDDPLFKSTAAKDFHLLAASPEIDSGNNSAFGLPATDLDGNTRVQDATGVGYPIVDLGAYEVSGQPRSAPTVATLTPCTTTPQTGSALSLTAGLSSPLGTPGGPVSLFMDLASTAFATAPLDATGHANFTVPGIAAGLHSFVVSYSGSTPYTAAASVALYVYAQASPSPCRSPSDTTATALTSSLNPAAFGQQVTFTASVTDTSFTSGLPAGSVVFSDGPTVISTQPLSQVGGATSTATLSTAVLSPGTHTITAVYSPTGNFSVSSASLSQTITARASTTTLTSSLNPAQFGQAVMFTANVSNPPGSSESPAGSVTFSAGTGVTVTQPLTSNGASASAAFSISTLPIGTQVITATYNPLVGSLTSKATLTETIKSLSTRAALTPSPNPSYPGQAVTLLVTVIAANSAQPSTGTVQFFDGGTSLGQSSLAENGSAVLTVSDLSVGTHTLSAHYLGNSTLDASQSNSVQQVVLNSNFTLVVDPPAITLRTQHHTTFNVEVTPVGLFSGSVHLDCTSLPAHATCRITPNAFTFAISGTKQTASVYLDTSDVIGFEGIGAQTSSRPTRKTLAALLLSLLSGIIVAARRKRLHQLRRLVLLAAVFFAVLFGSIGCSGRYPDSVAPGSYTITLTGMSAAQAQIQSAPLQLTVTPSGRQPI